MFSDIRSLIDYASGRNHLNMFYMYQNGLTVAIMYSLEIYKMQKLRTNLLMFRETLNKLTKSHENL